MGFLTAIPAAFSKLDTGGQITLTGVGISAGGTLLEAWSAGRTARYNVRAEEYRAQQLIDAGRIEVARARRAGKSLISAQRAVYGAAGVTLEGSPMEVMEETAVQIQSDIDLINYQTALGVRDAMMRRQLYSYSARTAPLRGILGAAGSILFGIGRVIK